MNGPEDSRVRQVVNMDNRRVFAIASPVSKGDASRGIRQQDVGVRDDVSTLNQHARAARDGRVHPNEGRRDDFIDFREGMMWKGSRSCRSACGVAVGAEESRLARVWPPAAVWQLAAV